MGYEMVCDKLSGHPHENFHKLNGHAVENLEEAKRLIFEEWPDAKDGETLDAVISFTTGDEENYYVWVDEVSDE